MIRTRAVAAAAVLSAAACASTTGAAPGVFFDAHEPSPAQPFGRLNPDAPDAVAAYDFMVGRWDCVDTVFAQGAEPTIERRRVHGQHYLNGYGYINHTYAESGVGVMTYLYDDANAAWVVDYTAAPNFAASRWTTVDIGEEGAIAIETPGQADGVTVRSVFHKVTENSFDWRLDIATPQGTFSARTSSCRRTA